MSLFGLLSAGDIEKNTVHHPIDDVRVVAFASCRYPPNLVAHHDSEVDFVGSDHSPGRGEGGANTIAIRGVDVGGQFFECDGVATWYIPQLECTVVHRQAIIIDVPGP